MFIFVPFPFHPPSCKTCSVCKWPLRCTPSRFRPCPLPLRRRRRLRLRRPLLARAHEDSRSRRCTVMSVSCKVLSCPLGALCPPLRSILTRSPFLPHVFPIHQFQCAPRSHTRAATRRSARSKRKSTLTNSSPSSGTRTRPCCTRRTSGYSSGSTSRACWMRRTRAPCSSLVMSWNASDDSRTVGGRR